MEVVLETESIETRRFTSEQLGNEVGLDCSGRTVQRAMGTMSYHKCTACRKGWVNERLAERRVQYASTMLQRYPEPKDWQRVKFSNEVYFGLGPERAIVSVSFKSPDNGIAMIVFRNDLRQRKKTKGEFIDGRQWVTTSSPTYISMIPAILMGR